ncbi:hypothetical protein [Roseateles sp.]|uniref:hypothetical protein n=1 Tax=Roseateles sp. TaxID=1971397 RepID=UPI0039E90659
MLIRRILLAAAMVAGAFSGPMALASAASSQPPTTWGELAFMALGALVGLPLVLGLQAMQGNFNALRLGWTLFLYVAAYCLTAGIAALVVAARGPGVAPHAFMFLLLGAAMLGGLALVRIVFRRRFTVH